MIEYVKVGFLYIEVFHPVKKKTANNYRTGLDSLTELLHITLQKQSTAPGIKTYTRAHTNNLELTH